mgnify:CR=1 FL=1
MRRKTRVGYALTGILALILIGAASFGAVQAWNTHTATQVNQLESHTVSATIEESFPDKTVKAGATKKKAVMVKNTGTAAAFVRVCVAEYWTTDTEQLLGVDEVTKNWSTAWKDNFELRDGWYYYKKVLPAGGSVQVLDSVTFPASVPNGASYHLDFQVETVQVSGEAAVNKDATNTLFGRTGTVSGMTTLHGAVTGGDVTWTN